MTVPFLLILFHLFFRGIYTSLDQYDTNSLV